MSGIIEIEKHIHNKSKKLWHNIFKKLPSPKIFHRIFSKKTSILLMVQKSPTTTVWMVLKPYNGEKNYLSLNRWVKTGFLVAINSISSPHFFSHVFFFFFFFGKPPVRNPRRSWPNPPPKRSRPWKVIWKPRTGRQLKKNPPVNHAEIFEQKLHICRKNREK